jgi:dynein heavy chain
MHAERKKGEVQQAKKKLTEREHAIQQNRMTLELDLQSAQPLLLEATSARDSVSKEEILFFGSHKNQPAVVKLVLDSVLLVLGHKLRPIEMQDARAYRDSFAYAIEMIMSPDSWERLQAVKCDGMNGETAELLAPYLNHKDYNLAKVKSVSGPAAGLAVWVQAMARYYDATSLIIPKIFAVGSQEDDLDKDYEGLAEQQDEYDRRQEELDEMHSAFEEAMAQRQKLKLAAGCECLFTSLSSPWATIEIRELRVEVRSEA